MNGLDENGALGRKIEIMYVRDLESVVGPLTHEILLSMEGDSKTFQPTFTGIVKGEPFNSDDITKYYPRRHLEVSENIFLRVTHVDDFSTNMGGGDWPVVVAVGINHGKATELDTLNCRGEVCAPTLLRERLDETFQTVEASNLHNPVPSPGTYHLLSVNLFPWATKKPWSALKVNNLDEALMLNLHGYRADDLLAPLEKLLQTLASKNGKPVTWIVFHGSENCVPLFGVLYAKRNDWTHLPEIMICDDLRDTGPIENCIVLDRPPNTREQTDLDNVDE